MVHGPAEGRADGGVTPRRAATAAEEVRVQEEGGRRQGRRGVRRRVGPVRRERLVRRSRGRGRHGRSRQVMLALKGKIPQLMNYE